MSNADHGTATRFDSADFELFRAARGSKSSLSAKVVIYLLNKYGLRAGDVICSDGLLRRVEHHGMASKITSCSLVTEGDGSLKIG